MVGKLQVLPSTFQFPKGLEMINVICDMWYRGNLHHNVPAYRMLEPGHVAFIRAGRNQVSKMKYVMKQVEKFSKEMNIWLDGRHSWTAAQDSG